MGDAGQAAASPAASPRPGRGHTGRLARGSPRKWLTQRLRRALGMWQMVTQRCRTDRGCPAGSPEPASSLSYLTPFSKMFATWRGRRGSAHRPLVRAPGSGRRGDACVLLR